MVYPLIFIPKIILLSLEPPCMYNKGKKINPRITYVVNLSVRHNIVPYPNATNTLP